MKINEQKLNRLITRCLFEAIDEITTYTDSHGEEHKYDKDEVKKALKDLKNDNGTFSIVRNCFRRGGWDFVDILRAEGGWTTYFALPSEGARVREFGMVAALIKDELEGAIVKQGAYSSDNTSETEGVHYVAIKL